MKTNELMINDWVKFKADTFGEQKQRVDYLESERVQERLKDDEPIATTANGTFFCTSFALQEYQVEPIPITAEILEANGFKNYKNIGSLRYYKNTEENLKFEFYGKTLEDYTGNRICEIGFVHELQHALRLFGFTDLADNFKVV